MKKLFITLLTLGALFAMTSAAFAAFEAVSVQQVGKNGADGFTYVLLTPAPGNPATNWTAGTAATGQYHALDDANLNALLATALTAVSLGPNNVVLADFQSDVPGSLVRGILLRAQ